MNDKAPPPPARSPATGEQAPPASGEQRDPLRAPPSLRRFARALRPAKPPGMPLFRRDW